MPRTDIHRPAALRPEDYEFAACGNFATAEIDAHAPLATSHRFLIDEGWRFDSQAGGHHCDHCGSFLVYYAILKHLPSHSLIMVGETCLDNRFSLANDEFQRLRAAAKLNRERKRLADKRAACLAEPDVAQAYAWAQDNPLAGAPAEAYEETFNEKYVRFIDRYGEASERFTAAILRAKARHEAFIAERAQRAAESQPCPEGRIIIDGEVLSVKTKDGPYGPRDVMTVRDSGRFTVWGSVPSAIADVKRGDRVRFVASLTPSETDKTFGFYKRPTSAEILDTPAPGC